MDIKSVIGDVYAHIGMYVYDARDFFQGAALVQGMIAAQEKGNAWGFQKWITNKYKPKRRELGWPSIVKEFEPEADASRAVELYEEFLHERS